MDKGATHVGIIWAIFKKDLKSFSRDRFFMFITVLGLVIYVAVYWLLPSTVNETITVGVHQTGMEKLFENLDKEEKEGVDLIFFDTAKELRAAAGLTGKKPAKTVEIGLDFPKDFLSAVTKGTPSTVTVYVDSSVPPEVRAAMSSLVKELAYTLVGQKLPVTEPDEETVVLGPDRAGNQISLRDKTRPLYAFLILVMETFALATLVAAEIQSRTVTAVLVTPAKIIDFLAAKGITGTTVAFTEAGLLMFFVGAFEKSPLILIVALLLGAVLVTGLGFIAGASGKDFIGIVFYSLLFMFPLLIPPFTVFFPGTASFWVKLLPSYGLVQTIVGAATYGEGWSAVLPDLAMLLAWCVVVFAAGAFVLKRKVESL